MASIIFGGAVFMTMAIGLLKGLATYTLTPTDPNVSFCTDVFQNFFACFTTTTLIVCRVHSRRNCSWKVRRHVQTIAPRNLTSYRLHWLLILNIMFWILYMLLWMIVHHGIVSVCVINTKMSSIFHAGAQFTSIDIFEITTA